MKEIFKKIKKNKQLCIKNGNLFEKKLKKDIIEKDKEEKGK